MQLRMDIVLQVSRKLRKSPQAIFNLAAIWAGQFIEDGRIEYQHWLVEEVIPRWVVDYCLECLKRKPDSQRRH